MKLDSANTPAQQSATAGAAPQAENFFDQFDAQPAAGNFFDQFDTAAGAEDIDRTWGEAATDTGAAVMGGFASLGGSIAHLADTFTFGLVDIGARQVFADAQDFWEQQKSDSMKQAKQQLHEADGVMGPLGAVWDKPELAVDMLAGSAPHLLIPAMAARKAMITGGTAAATRAGMLSGGVMEGADAGSSAYNEVADMTPAQLMEQSSLYREMTGQGMSHDEAIEKLAYRAGLTAQAVATPISILASKLTGAAKLEADFYTGHGTKDLLSTLGKETADEVVQEGGNAFGVNVGLAATADDDRDLTEGVAKSATLGGVLGAGQAGGMKALGGVVPATQAIADKLSAGEPVDLTAMDKPDPSPLEGQVIEPPQEEIIPEQFDPVITPAPFEPQPAPGAVDPVTEELRTELARKFEQEDAAQRQAEEDAAWQQHNQHAPQGVPIDEGARKAAAWDLAGREQAKADARAPAQPDDAQYFDDSQRTPLAYMARRVEGKADKLRTKIEMARETPASPAMASAMQQALEQAGTTAEDIGRAAQAKKDDAMRATNKPPRPSRFFKVDPGKDDIMTAIRKLGGWNSAEAYADGIDKEDFRQLVGAHRPIHANGRTLDDLRESLVEHGYLNQNDSVVDLREKIDRTLRGDAVYSLARSESDRLQAFEDELRQRAAEDDSDAIEQLAARDEEHHDLVDPREAVLAGAVADAVEAGASAQEINKALSGDDFASQIGTLHGLIGRYRHERQQKAHSQSRQADSGRPEEEGLDAIGTRLSDEDAEAFWGSVTGESDLLESYSEDDLKAKTTRENDEAAKAKADQRAQVDREREQFALDGGSTSVIGSNDALQKGQAGDLFVASRATSVAEKAATETPKASPQTPEAPDIDAAAHEAATSPHNDLPEPTEAQKEAGNYKKGRIEVHGLKIAVENPAGSKRSGTDPDGNAWEHTMPHHYGYLSKTEGADSEQIDVFVGPETDSQKAYIVDQVNADGTFDEHKVLLGFSNKAKAITGYKSAYDNGWKVGPTTTMTVDEFKAWLKDGDTTQPLSSKLSAKADKGRQNVTPEIAAKIDDVGERLEGARKHLKTFTTEIKDADLASLPLSKIWPADAFNDLGDTKARAFAFAARQEIPAKPRKSYKVNRWVETVKMYRELMGHLLTLLESGSDAANQLLDKMRGKSDALSQFAAKVELLAALDPAVWGRVERVREYPDAFNYDEDRNQIPAPVVYVTIDGANKKYDGKSWSDALDGVIADLGAKPEARPDYGTYEVRGRKDRYFINRKGDREYRPLKIFTGDGALNEARAYLKDKPEALAEAWEAIKARDNVGKGDMRGDENAPRVGADHRKGKDVSAEEFAETFGFRGVQFGNWMKQGKGMRDRQGAINAAYDALMDLAGLINVPPKAISLNGDLGLAFGARGKGKAAAHYEPGNLVINLTKTQGAGSLAHEWFHALDNYFQRQRGDTGSNHRESLYITFRPEPMMVHKTGRIAAITKAELARRHEQHPDAKIYDPKDWQEDPSHKAGVRPEVEIAFAQLVEALDSSPMRSRAARIDNGKADGYWSRIIERAARSFENYVIAKLADGGYRNDYLANVTSIEKFIRNPDRYPYLLDSEMAPVKEAFDNLFSTVKVKETEKGAALYSLAGNYAGQSDAKKAQTGKPLSIRFAHNTESATDLFGKPDKSSPYGRGYEPSGRFVTVVDQDYAAYPGQITGELHFKNPLVVENNYNAWKKSLSERYSGKTGKALSKAVIADGYDAIVTTDGEYFSEVVDLTTFDESKARYAGGAGTGTKPGPVKAALAKLEKRTGIAATVVADESGLPAHHQANIRQHRVTGKVRGLYDIESGDVYVVAGNLSSTEDAVRVYLHEVVGHRGIRAATGKRLDLVLTQIYRDMPADIRSELEARYGGQTATVAPAEAKRIIADEYVAHLAETDPRNGLLQRVISAVRNWLRELFPSIEWTTADIAELLRKGERSLDPKGAISINEGDRYALTGKRDELRLKKLKAADGSAIWHNGEVTIRARRQRKRLASELPWGHDAHVPEGVEIWEQVAYSDGVVIAKLVSQVDAQGNIVGIHDIKAINKGSGAGEKVIASVLASIPGDLFVVEAIDSAQEFWSKMGANGFFDPYKNTRISWADYDRNRSRREAARENQQGDGGGVRQSGALRQAVPGDGAESDAGAEGGGRVRPETLDQESLDWLNDFNSRYSLNDDRDLLQKIGLAKRESDTLAKKIRAITTDQIKRALSSGWQRFHEGAADGLIGIDRAERAVGRDKETIGFDKSGYVGARLASSIGDTMTAVLQYGAPVWRDGVIQYKAGTRGLLDILADLDGGVNDWLAWMAGNRAEELMRQGRENNLTADDIQALKAKSAGKERLFEQVRQDYLKLNNAMLDLSQEAGLIDPAARQNWQSDWYVPFYRVTDMDGDAALMAPRTQRGLSHQSAGIKALRGGDLPTNDLLENLLTNWVKLTDSAVKNMALLKTVDNLKDTPFLTDESLKYTQAIVPRAEITKRIKGDRNYLQMVADQLGMVDADEFDVLNELAKLDSTGFEKLWAITAPTDKDVIRVQRGGKNEYYKVNDPSLLRAVTHLGFAGFNDPITRTARNFKRLLTTGVTAAPDFILRNFVRDAAHAWAINPDSFKFARDSFKGLKNAMQEDEDYRALMFANASFQGGYVHGTDPEESAQQIRRLLRKKGLTGGKADAFVKSLLTPDAVLRLWEKYRTLSDKVENANRLATFKAAIAAGKPMAQAVYESKDLMDYSLRGNFQAMMWFTDVVPFLNARIQGLSKLGRAAAQHPKIVSMKMGAIVAFSLALAALNDDNDEYKKLPDWDKDAYWHLFFGDEHWRIPKPFEIGVLAGTMPERLFHNMSGAQDNDKLWWSIKHNLTSTLQFNPLPQMILPAVEVWGNRSFHFDSPIESMADQNKLPEARYNAYTSETMKALGKWTGTSPKQLEHLLEGYTGTLGSYALMVMDAGVRLMADTAPRPEGRWEDLPVIKSFYRGDDEPTSTQYKTDFYDRWQEIKQIGQTVKRYQEEGDGEAARELIDESRNKLKLKGFATSIDRQLRDIRKQRERIYNDRLMLPEAKRRRLNELQARENTLLQRFSEVTEPVF